MCCGSVMLADTELRLDRRFNARLKWLARSKEKLRAMFWRAHCNGVAVRYVVPNRVLRERFRLTLDHVVLAERRKAISNDVERL